MLAGPGTGKTVTLAERMIQLIQEDRERYVVFVTFTRSSRKDTRQKVEAAVGDAGREIAGIPNILTLHRFCKGLVHQHHMLFGLDRFFPVPLVKQGEQLLLVSETMVDTGLKGDLEELEKLVITKRATLKPASSQNFSEEDIKLATMRFEELLDFYGALDMEGVVKAATRLISEEPSRLPPMFLQIDEFQDLNPNDQAFVDALLTSKRHEIIIVGDDTQSIYGFRHAFPEGIRTRFDSSEWAKQLLSECHRLPAGILRAANALVMGRGYYGSKMQIPSRGDPVPTYRCTTTDVEKDWVASLIKSHTATDGGGDALKYSDFMILCPTRNIADGFAGALVEKHGIPAKVIRGRTIPEDEWRLVLVLRMIRSNDNLALRQWLEIMGLDTAHIETLRKEAEDEGRSLFQKVRGLANGSLQKFLRSLESLIIHKGDLIPTLDKLREFPNLSVSDEILWEAGFTEEPEADYTLSAHECIEKIYEEYGVLDVEDAELPQNAVSVATFHSAKGLEAEVVFVVRLEDRLLPLSDKDQEEQRRLLYVAMTRAKSKLILSFPERYDERSKTRLREEAMSPLLREIKNYLRVEGINRESIPV